MTYSQQIFDAVIHAVSNGASFKQAAAQFNISPRTVSRWARSLGVTPPPRTDFNLTDQHKHAFALIDNGMSFAQTATIVDMPLSTLRVTWRKHHPNVTLTRRRRRTDQPHPTITPMNRAGDEQPRIGMGVRLSFHDRVHLSFLHNQGLSTRAIATQMSRSQSTIARELARNTTNGVYTPVRAQAAADARRARPKSRTLDTNPRLRRAVVHLFTHRRSTRIPLNSPATVARRLKTMYPNDASKHISHESIYQALYIRGAGSLRQELKVEKALRSGRAGRQPRSPLAGMAHTRRARSWVAGAEIALRDKDFPEIQTKQIPGHWEGDLIIGNGGSSALITLVERASRYCLIRRLGDNHESKTVTECLTEMVTQVADPAAWKTLTWDQGVEMAKHQQFFHVHDDFKVYFADPHSPWQRGANENINRQIREFFPKGTDFATVTDQQIEDVQVMLNDRARMALDGYTPAETLPRILADALTPLNPPPYFVLQD